MNCISYKAFEIFTIPFIPKLLEDMDSRGRKREKN